MAGSATDDRKNGFVGEPKRPDTLSGILLDQHQGIVVLWALFVADDLDRQANRAGCREDVDPRGFQRQGTQWHMPSTRIRVILPSGKIALRTTHSYAATTVVLDGSSKSSSKGFFETAGAHESRLIDGDMANM